MHILELNPPCIRPLHDSDIDRLLVHHPKLPMRPEDCLTCKGSGQFRWYADGEIVDYACDCTEQMYLHHWLLHAGIDRTYQRLGWTDAVGVEQQALDAVLNYATKIEAYAERGIGLVLYGDKGTGKSMLASLLLKRLISDGYRGYFSTFQQLLDLFTSGWSDDNEKRWFEKRITNAEVLVIDDMAREYAGRLGVAGPLVDHVLRTRVAAQRPTIITTNKTLDDLGELYSVNALSLLTGCSLVVEFRGADYRPEQLQRLMAEADQGLTRPFVLS